MSNGDDSQTLWEAPAKSVISVLKMSVGVFQTQVLSRLCTYESWLFGHAH